MHVDAAYAGAAASLPEKKPLFAGWEEADSIVWNPHKWLFLPLECTGLFFRRMDRVRRAFSVVPTYLETPEGSAGVREYMDYGIQLGRRFRALKTWIMLRTFGAKGLRERLQSHLDLARHLEADLRRERDVEILAPVLFSVVVFRFAPAHLSEPERDTLNQRVLEEVNREGRFFISHGVVKGRYALHAAIGSLRTEERHVAGLLESLRAARNGAEAAETAKAPRP
jgi:aromatic-L-amino-acid decarboxylase